MLRNFLKNKKAQHTAEYALLIALVVAGVIAMQTYAQRSLQARIRDAGHYLTSSNNATEIGNTNQYEPYYLNSEYQVTRTSEENTRLGGNGLVAKDVTTNRARTGNQAQQYNTDVSGLSSNNI